MKSARSTNAAFLVALGGALFVAFACERQPPLPPPNVVARIGDRDVPYARFEAYLQRNVGDSGGVLASEALSRLFDQFVEEELLAALAVDRGLAAPTSASIQAIEALLASTARADPPEADIAAEYERRRSELALPERVHLRQILVDDRLAAERARRELTAGADFGEVVARLTPAGEAPAGADQGVLAREELPPAFADLIFALEEGEASAVVPAGYGFHVFQVVRKLPAEELSLDRAAASIRADLVRAAADAELAALAREARSRYTVAVYDRNLPFNYRGALPVSRPHENR